MKKPCAIMIYADKGTREKVIAEILKKDKSFRHAAINTRKEKTFKAAVDSLLASDKYNYNFIIEGLSSLHRDYNIKDNVLSVYIYKTENSGERNVIIVDPKTSMITKSAETIADLCLSEVRQMNRKYTIDNCDEIK